MGGEEDAHGAIVGRDGIKGLAIRRLVQSVDDGFSVGRPRGPNHGGGGGAAGFVGEHAFTGAVGISDVQADVTSFGLAAEESEALGVGRKRGAGVDVANDLAGSTAEDGHLVERAEEVVLFAGGGE